MLGDNLLLPVALNFAQVPSGGDIAAAQIIRLSRSQIQYCRCGEGNCVLSLGNLGEGRLSKEFRSNGAWVDTERPDAWILCRVLERLT
jgi:hypothetical protein